jgi:CheY-like chemotaxis protein
MNEYSENNELLFSETSYGIEDRDKYIKIFEVLPCPVILMDKNDNIKKMNYEASCIFNNTDLQDEVIKLILNFKTERETDKLNEKEIFKGEILTEEGIKYFEIRKISMSCIQDLDYMLVFNDFTEHKLLEERLKKEKVEIEMRNINDSKLFTSISHEIRTAISGIIGMADLTLMTGLTLEQKENLNLIKSSGLKLLSIINRILDYSKVQLERVKIENIEFNFKEFINEIIKGYSLRAIENGLEFKAKLDEDIPEMIIGDPIKIEKILDSIVQSSMKFTKSGTVALIVDKEEISDKKINLKMCIKDTDLEIYKKDMFNKFNKINNKDYIKNQKDTDFYFDVYKELVEKMGGKIKIESKKELGTIFSFNVILEKVKKYNSMGLICKNNKHVTSLRTSKKLNILIVEDDRASQMVMYNLFKRYGHICDIANNGQEALKKIKNRKYDLILMDIQMPMMDGIQATKIIRKSEENENRHIPIIALTAHALKGDREKLLGSGMDGYISKPFNIEELLQTVYNSIKDDGRGADIISNKKNMDEDDLFLYLL